MKEYRVVDIISSFGLFLDDIIEAENEYDAMEEVLMQISDNIGNYIDIEVEEMEDNNNE